MFIVLFIRNRGILSSHMWLFKDLAYYVWRDFFFQFFFSISEKKDVKLEKNRTNGHLYYWRSFNGNQKPPFFMNFDQFSIFENEKNNCLLWHVQCVIYLSEIEASWVLTCAYTRTWLIICEEKTLKNFFLISEFFLFEIKKKRM